ncbi:LysE family translocator [Thalassobius sp. S69A]|uniref:LysE family translocator n=1 Tax=unclassified Thalassovita TaxID=2619711 RepID=UPI000C11BC68|nr:lysine transporter LysE [Paracoccaceae bacterium]MBT26478.1 lysine transporter LysE [Paracoccaceae bacterium]
MDLNVWLSFVAASVALLIIPGPTVLLVLSYAISQGRRVALATVAGVALGDLVAMTASLLGLGAIIMTSALAFSVLKWVGAAYLIWLGLKMLRSAKHARLEDMPDPAPGNGRRVMGHAALVTALNPKGIGFFIAFVPQFVNPNAQLAPQFAVIIATFIGLSILVALVYTLLADRLRARIRRPSVQQWLTRTGGMTLIGMGLFTATLRRAS